MSDNAPARPADPDRRGPPDSGSAGAARRSADHSALRHSGVRAKTSAAAVFSLVFGLIAVLDALTGLLVPVAVVVGVVGLVLGIVGIRRGAKPLKAGTGVAIGGLVLSVIALLLCIAALVGVATTLTSNPQLLDQIDNLVSSVRVTIPGA